MNKLTFTTYAKENGGRVSILFLLFLLALYELVTAGLNAFSIICILPLFPLILIGIVRKGMLSFWTLIILNYFIMWHGMPLPKGIPMSLYNELLEIILIALAIINAQDMKFERCGNMMFFTLFVWCAYCILEIFNNTCGLGINPAAWYQGVRLIAFQLMYAFIVFTLYITDPKILTKYIFLWGCLALMAVFTVWKQKYIGLSTQDIAWLYGPGGRQHLIAGGTLIRYWSLFSDAANFGVGIASTGVAFVIFGITSRIKKHKIFFLVTGFGCIWAMFPSGTRTAIACLMAGFMAYIFLSKSFKIAIPVSIVFALFVFILAFTNIGNGNQQIRRMRSAFNKNDASTGAREMNKQTMRKYMKEAPFGIGIGMSNVPANNKYNKIVSLPADSEYVYIWLRTGQIGITIFIICTALMIIGGCRIVFFKLKSPSLRGIGAGFCCAMISQQLGGYGNQVLMQFPNCLTFYGGLALVYVLPHIENEWIEYEKGQLAIQEEKKRLKLEKKQSSRV